MSFASRLRQFPILAIAVIFTSASGTALAVPVGYESNSITFPTGFKGAAALAFAPNGTLYVVEGKDFIVATNQTTIHVVNPDGSMGTPIPLAGDDYDVTVMEGNIAVGGIAVHPTTGDLYITDNAPGAATLYRVDPATGVKTSFSPALNLPSIDDVAIRSTGEVFVSDAVGGGAGTVTQVDSSTGTPVATPVSGLEYAAGLAFDSAGNLIYQQSIITNFSPFESHAEVHRLEVTKPVTSLIFGATTQLADDLAGTFDLTVDSEDDIFVTGVGGLYDLDRAKTGTPLFSESVFDAQGFSTESAFLPGTGLFEPFSGSDGGVLAYIPSFNSTTVTLITPLAAAAVPEPNALVASLVAIFTWLVLRGARRKKRRERE